MLKHKNTLKEYVEELIGFTKPVIDQLKNNLNSMKDERRTKLKDFIIENRNFLDQWWTKCCYSDNQCAQFKAYGAVYYSEDVLELHEIELESVKMFYNKHKHIFQLAERHVELWKHLLKLEEQVHDKNRLKNRGGQLLLEEKERYSCQKLPAIKKELISLLTSYQHETGKDFLYFGSPLIETVTRMEDKYEAAKENWKQQRILQRQNEEALQSPRDPRDPSASRSTRSCRYASSV